MGNKVLNIVESGYRATLEEQDDTIVWISHALRGAGADVHLLLKGNAVGYSVRDQNPPALKFGNWTQSHPPNLAGDLKSFLKKGGEIFAIQEDLEARGIGAGELLQGVHRLPVKKVAGLFADYDHVWHW